MFVTMRRSGYTRDGSQFAQGMYLILALPDDAPNNPAIWRDNVRGIVRSVSLRQLGQFMMGRVTIAGHKLSVSGSYGSDGLLKDVPRKVWERGVPLPPALYDAWAHGNGWNGAGNEADAMREWARATFPQVTR